MAEYFEDYYDDEGNLHIDARKPYNKKETVKNIAVKLYSIKADNTIKKLIIHHCDLID